MALKNLTQGSDQEQARERQYIFFLSAPETLTKIGHVLGKVGSLNKFQRISIIQTTFSYHVLVRLIICRWKNPLTDLSRKRFSLFTHEPLEGLNNDILVRIRRKSSQNLSWTELPREPLTLPLPAAHTCADPQAKIGALGPASLSTPLTPRSKSVNSSG